MASELDLIPNDKDILNVVKSCDSNKASDYDGLTSGLFWKCGMHVLGQEVLLLNFFLDG